MADASLKDLKDRIEAIEVAYEFMLGYAAQGHTSETEGPGGVRDHLTRAGEALGGLGDLTAAFAPDGNAAWSDFIELLARDAEKARMVVGFVLAQEQIGSQLIDNLNASLHLRTVLTDLFLLDEATGGPGDD
ncbi:MAG: hypothetical protein OEQ29_06790 [Alphaproteobacteria bacterium]|nr:hypothetical protein [Alphaproteobacteria bacterium]